MEDTDRYTRSACSILMDAAVAVQAINLVYLHTPDVYDPTMADLTDIAIAMKSSVKHARIVASYRMIPDLPSRVLQDDPGAT